jgi:hypothetical protein
VLADAGLRQLYGVERLASGGGGVVFSSALNKILFMSSRVSSRVQGSKSSAGGEHRTAALQFETK